MTWARVFLVFEGLVFAASGCVALLNPDDGAQVLDYGLPTPSATVEFMSMYGGFELGFGAFLVWCAVRKAYLPAGLLALVFAVGAAGGARLVGMATQGAVKPIFLAILAFEIATALLAALYLRSVVRRARLG